MLPDAKIEFAGVVFIWVKALGEWCMCKISGLFQAIHAFPYFHVYQSIFVYQVIEAVFSSNVIPNDGNRKMHVFILVQGCSEVVTFNVECKESCIGDEDSCVEY